jgi:hypothetical protein
MKLVSWIGNFLVLLFFAWCPNGNADKYIKKEGRFKNGPWYLASLLISKGKDVNELPAIYSHKMGKNK